MLSDNDKHIPQLARLHVALIRDHLILDKTITFKTFYYLAKIIYITS